MCTTNKNISYCIWLVALVKAEGRWNVNRMVRHKAPRQTGLHDSCIPPTSSIECVHFPCEWCFFGGGWVQ